MLDLQAGVHLDEIELAVLVEGLDGAGAAVAERAHGLADTPADGLALGRVECRRQRLLQHLLVTALQRAVALAAVDRATLAVGQKLPLVVARPADALLHVDFVVAEGSLRLRARAP